MNFISFDFNEKWKHRIRRSQMSTIHFHWFSFCKFACAKGAKGGRFIRIEFLLPESPWLSTFPSGSEINKNAHNVNYYLFIGRPHANATSEDGIVIIWTNLVDILFQWKYFFIFMRFPQNTAQHLLFTADKLTLPCTRLVEDIRRGNNSSSWWRVFHLEFSRSAFSRWEFRCFLDSDFDTVENVCAFRNIFIDGQEPACRRRLKLTQMKHTQQPENGKENDEKVKSLN